MKARKLAIRPWLSYPYNEHTLVDLPSSVPLSHSKESNLFGQLYLNVENLSHSKGAVDPLTD